MVLVGFWELIFGGDRDMKRYDRIIKISNEQVSRERDTSTLLKIKSFKLRFLTGRKKDNKIFPDVT